MRRKVTIALITAAGFYLVLCAIVYFLQDAIMFPGANRGGAVTSLVNVSTSRLQTAGGIEYRIAIGVPTGKPRGVLVHFVGNGEDLASGVYRAALFAGYGFKTLVTEYPGYGASDGAPGYDSILAAAEASAAEARQWADVAQLPLYISGQSLGSFCAVHVASQGFGSKLLLISPPTSAAAAGQRSFPFLPIAMLLRHPFDNLKNAAAITMPTLIIHGDQDSIIPTSMGEQLATAMPAARLHIAKKRGHNDLDLGPTGSLAGVIREHFFE